MSVGATRDLGMIRVFVVVLVRLSIFSVCRCRGLGMNRVVVVLVRLRALLFPSVGATRCLGMIIVLVVVLVAILEIGGEALMGRAVILSFWSNFD